MTALSNCSLYSKDHPAILYLSDKAVRTIDDLYSDDLLNLTLLGNRLLVNDAPVLETGIHISSFIKKLRRKGIEKILIRKGIDAEELKSFIVELASSEIISSTFPHLSTGIIDIKLSQVGDDVQAVMNENISKVKDVFHGLSRFKKLNMLGLEDVVISFISALKREANILRVISPVKSYSEYTYAHTTNVAILSIFQAEALGLKGDVLHAIGIAGLLHDVGKMYISKEVLEKQEKLTEEEWSEIKKHPLRGALYLARLPEIPKLAVIATFEHHMKFDGSGYPEPKLRGKKPHVISQIIALSDFFDAIRTKRPYRKALEMPQIMMILQNVAGTEFDPLLVENFFVALNKVNAS
jgi:HD-GYP domain-containing protein (c-di-GMP phosphodiesterase class II)